MKTSTAKLPARKAAKPTEKPGTATRRAEATDHDLKVVRDGFTMPQADYDKLKALKAVCLKHGIEVKKSELLRAGVLALAAMPVNTLVTRIRALAPVKAGRKKK